MYKTSGNFNCSFTDNHCLDCTGWGDYWIDKKPVAPHENEDYILGEVFYNITDKDGSVLQKGKMIHLKISIDSWTIGKFDIKGKWHEVGEEPFTTIID